MAVLFQGVLTLNSWGASPAKSYHFDEKGISREALDNYLARSITMACFLTPHLPEGSHSNPYHDDDKRMLKEIGAKFIGRAIYRWGGESHLSTTEFWSNAREIIQEFHAFDPDIVFQSCLFEVVTREVGNVPIPAWVFEGYGLPVEERNFSYEKMLNEKGVFVDHWSRDNSVPDISRQETQLWFYYLAGAYMEVGCEAFHLGQVELIGMNDPERKAWAAWIAKIRELAKKKVRRHWIILDAHVPHGGMLLKGKSLIDFNSFPLRVKDVPEKPMGGKLEVNYLDSIYKKSLGCETPSGWSCEHLPYLVEFDNYGRSKNPGVANEGSYYAWGWDEISWYSLLPEEERNSWLEYAYNWLKKTDSDGHLQMPGNRIITCPNKSEGRYRANQKSEQCPIGYSQEGTIKKLWNP